jgi:hypothetical protein
MSLPPAFTQSFFRKLAAYAKEFKTSRTAFAMQAIDRYAEELRRKKSVAAKTLGSVELANQYAEMVGKVTRSWWAKQSPEEKTARAKKAAEARWAKKHKQQKPEPEPPAE